MELLNATHIKKIYNTLLGARQCVAVNDINFTVEKGEFLAIMGPSGSGKTTLMNILASLDKPTSGEVLLNGKSFNSIKDSDLARFRRDNLGFVFQDFNLLDTFSIKDNILLPLVLANTPIEEMEKKIKPISDRLGITELFDKYPYEVSGGEKQRAAVARAVITEPLLLLADEPTGALDSKASANLLNIFKELNELGQTILMVTHSTDAASYANRVLFIKDGQLINQLYKGNNSRKEFFERIINTLSVINESGDYVG